MEISKRAAALPSSAIRKLVPLSDAAEAKGIHVYHLNVGAPDIKSPDCALQAVAQKCQSLHHLSYTNSAGFAELRKDLIDKYYSKLGFDLKLENILINVAGTESFAQAIQIVSDPGDEIIVVEPFYTNYKTFCVINQVELKAVHSDIKEGFRIPDISEFEKVLSPRTKAVLISNPCNPSGKLFSMEEMLQIGEFCKKNNLFLICDEVYREFCYTDEPHFSCLNLKGLEENVIMCDSVSKRYNLCGARIGCIVSKNPQVMAAALKYSQSRLCPPVLGQYAALGALDTPQSYFDEVKQEYIRRRDYTLSRLNAIPGVYSPVPLGAFYAIASLPVENAEDFCRWMLTDFVMDSATTMVTPIETFYCTPGCGRNQIRLAYVLELDKLEKALDILEAGLAAYTSLK
ncbi:MAG: pyridoxal phosphate-dependent aminotransferase [Candidatus Cryptobacteroides sp.]